MARKKRRSGSMKKSSGGGLVWFGVILLLICIVAYCFRSEIKAAISAQYRTENQVRLSHYSDLEIPARLEDRPEFVIKYKGYTISYNKEWKIPNWVAYELTRDEAKGNESRYDKFEIDPRLYADRSSATNADYTRSGYDRGHMAPAGDMKWDSEAMKESFYFSNICPQDPGLNRKAWKWLESKIRYWSYSDSAIVVVCGPIVSPEDKTIGKNGVRVPSAFYKVVCAPYLSTPKGIAFIMKNRNEEEPLARYAVTIDSVERVTGIDFLPLLPDNIEDRIESECDTRQWNF